MPKDSERRVADLRDAPDVPYRQRLLRAEQLHAEEVRAAAEGTAPPMGDPPNPEPGYVPENVKRDDEALAEQERERQRAGRAEAERAERVAKAREKVAAAEREVSEAERKADNEARDLEPAKAK